MITDGTYSHRRNAQWCVVPFMSHVYNLIFYVKVSVFFLSFPFHPKEPPKKIIKVGNQKELKKTANQLEFEISKQALIEISKMEDFKVFQFLLFFFQYVYLFPLNFLSRWCLSLMTNTLNFASG